MKKENASVYKKVMNRGSLTVLDCEYWYKGEGEEMARVTEGRVFFNPVFIYTSDKGVGIFYNYSDPRQDQARLFAYLRSKEKVFAKWAVSYEAQCARLTNLSKNATVAQFAEMYQTLISFWALLAIVMLVGDGPVSHVPKAVIAHAVRLRHKTDMVAYDAGDAFQRLSEELMPRGRTSWAEYLTFAEISTGAFPSPHEILRRKKGYILYDGVVSSETEIGEFARKHNIIFEDEMSGKSFTGTIQGTVACKGTAKGIVKIIYIRDQLCNIAVGDILVAPMTTPDLLPAMQKAAAFVTDEGGITCHAAIVAREMGKPCIIGTKVATQVLRDGNLVEVDANRGIITVLK